MKIFVASDMHLQEMENFRYFEEFCKFTKANNPDAVFLLGDFCETALPAQKDVQEYLHLMQNMRQIAEYELVRRSRHKSIEISPYEFALSLPIIAEEILFKKPYPKEIKAMAEAYLDKLDEAEWYANNIYHIANHHIDSEKTIVIPGNHDIDLEQTVLKNMNIHRKSKTIGTFKISGYGGAADQEGRPLFSGCPAELTTPFNEYAAEKQTLEGKVKELVSEPLEFFSEEQPDIALIHMPIYGVLDRIEEEKYAYLCRNAIASGARMEQLPDRHLGSRGLRKYADKGITKLFLSGHVHEDAGIEQVEAGNQKYIVINPGSLGVTNTKAQNRFVEVHMDDDTKEFVSAAFYRIHKGYSGIYIDPIMKFIRDKNSNLKELIVNPFDVNTEYRQKQHQNAEEFMKRGLILTERLKK